MADSFKRLVGPSQLGTSSATFYTVPGSTQAIVREIHVSNGTGSDVTLFLSIGADSAATRFVDGPTVPKSGGIFQLQCLIPLEAGETLRGFAGAGSSLTIVVSGVLGS